MSSCIAGCVRRGAVLLRARLVGDPRAGMPDVLEFHRGLGVGAGDRAAGHCSFVAASPYTNVGPTLPEVGPTLPRCVYPQPMCGTVQGVATRSLPAPCARCRADGPAPRRKSAPDIRR